MFHVEHTSPRRYLIFAVVEGIWGMILADRWSRVGVASFIDRPRPAEGTATGRSVYLRDAYAVTGAAGLIAGCCVIGAQLRRGRNTFAGVCPLRRMS